MTPSRPSAVARALACLCPASPPGARAASAKPAPDQATPAQAVYAVAIVDLYPNKAAAGLSLLQGYAASAATRPGCLDARLIREQPPLLNHFILLTTWRSEADREADERDPAARQFRDELLPLTASPVDERFYTAAP